MEVGGRAKVGGGANMGEGDPAIARGVVGTNPTGGSGGGTRGRPGTNLDSSLDTCLRSSLHSSADGIKGTSLVERPTPRAQGGGAAASLRGDALHDADMRHVTNAHSGLSCETFDEENLFNSEVRSEGARHGSAPAGGGRRYRM